MANSRRRVEGVFGAMAAAAVVVVVVFVVAVVAFRIVFAFNVLNIAGEPSGLRERGGGGRGDGGGRVSA